MSHSARVFFAIPTLLLLLGCAERERLVIEVAHYQTGRVAEGELMCFIVDGSAVLYDIKGLDYEWGYNYTLEVEIDQADGPKTPGNFDRYTLVTVIAKTRVPSTERFEVDLPSPAFIVPGALTPHAILDGPDLDCATNELCDELTSQLEDKSRSFSLTLSHPEEDGRPLLLHAITPAPTS
jgi:hypothetical protein